MDITELICLVFVAAYIVITGIFHIRFDIDKLSFSAAMTIFEINSFEMSTCRT